MPTYCSVLDQQSNQRLEGLWAYLFILDRPLRVLRRICPTTDNRVSLSA